MRFLNNNKIKQINLKQNKILNFTNINIINIFIFFFNKSGYYFMSANYDRGEKTKQFLNISY